MVINIKENMANIITNAIAHIDKSKSSINPFYYSNRVDYNEDLYGKPIVMGISYDGVLDESIVDITRKQNKENFHLNLDHLSSAISKSTLPKNLITYSGIYNPEPHEGMVHIPYHMSSSIDPITAHNFALKKIDSNGIAHIARIQHYKGQKGILLNPELTTAQHERELLIPARTNFRVSFHPEEIHDDDGKLTHKIWDFIRFN